MPALKRKNLARQPVSPGLVLDVRLLGMTRVVMPDVMLVELHVVLLRGNQCRARKHHQQKDGCNHLPHGKNLARKTAGELCLASSPEHARPAA
jgi:hypothetical protein